MNKKNFNILQNVYISRSPVFTDNNSCTKFVISCYSNFNFHNFFFPLARFTWYLWGGTFWTDFVHQNPTKGGVAFSGFSARFPPPSLTGLSSKCHNFFSTWSLLSLEKYVRQKYLLCLFSKMFFEFVCFPPFLPCFWPKNAFFGLKSRILMGNRQTKNFFKKIKSLSVLDTFSSPGCTKSSKFERVMIV